MNFNALEKELDVVVNNYFDDIVSLSEKQQEKGKLYTKTEVLFNNKKYFLYEYDCHDKLLSNYSLFLVPKYFDLKKDIYDVILYFSCGYNGYTLSKYIFSDDCVDYEDYNFVLGSDSYSEDTMTKNSVSCPFDKNEFDSLLKSSENDDLFCMRNVFTDYLKNNKTSFLHTIISRNNNTTKHIMLDLSNDDNFDSLKKVFNDSNYTIINDNETSLFDLINNLSSKKTNH